jgi:hypothetical protein
MDLLNTLRNFEWYDGKDEDKQISASSLANEPLELWLHKHKFEKNKYELTDATFGSLAHLALEKVFEQTEEFKDGRIILEHRYFKKLKDYTISGKIDMLDLEKSILWDFKTGKNYSKKMLDKEGKNHRYAIQLSVYRWLLHREDLTAKILWIMKDSKAAEREPVFIEQEVELMSFDEVEEYIQSKVDILEAYGDTMPDKCKDLWPRKVKGALVNTKCMFYCNYSKSCPHNNPTKLEVASTW